MTIIIYANNIKMENKMKKRYISLLTFLAVIPSAMMANSVQNSIDLSIKKLIIEVTKRNPNMIFDRMQSDIIDNQIKYEGSIFTPQFYANLTHQESDTPNNTEATLSRGYLQTYSEVTDNAQVGVSGVLSTGAKYNTAIKMNSRESSLIEKYKEYDTEYDNSFELSFTQPILKDFGSTATLSRYHLAKADKTIFDKQYKKRLMDMMGSVIQTYWKFYATKQLQISYKKSIEINKKTIELLIQKELSGDIAYSEVLEAKSATMMREAELKRVESELTKIKNDVLTLLNVSVQSHQDIVFNLIDEIDLNSDHIELSLEEYYTQAVQNWPELSIAKEKLKKEELQLEITKNQIKPQLDFVAIASSATLDDESNYRYYENDFITWSVGLQFSIPIFDDQSTSVLNMTKIKKRQIELEIQTLDNSLYNAISTKLNTLKNSKKQVVFYQDGLDIKKKLYGYTKKSFDAGAVSIKDVLMQESDIIEYQRKLFSTILDYKLAQVSLDKAVGSLFDNYLSAQEIKNLQDIELTQTLSNDSFGQVVTQGLLD